jgi:excisionase family DNA binding protein
LEEVIFGLPNPVDGEQPLFAGKSVPSPYLTASEAAAYLRITVASLYGLVDRGQIKPLRGPRRSYRFTTAMLDAYVQRRHRE